MYTEDSADGETTELGSKNEVPQHLPNSATNRDLPVSSNGPIGKFLAKSNNDQVITGQNMG